MLKTCYSTGETQDQSDQKSAQSASVYSSRLEDPDWPELIAAVETNLIWASPLMNNDRSRDSLFLGTDLGTDLGTRLSHVLTPRQSELLIDHACQVS